jgi:uncharacterized YigZ family protein
MTLSHEGSDETVIQKSRFIGYASPAVSEEEAMFFIRTIRERHRDATHNCYAYIVGKNQGIIRYSDDGEPSGTAGLPMLDVLKNKGLTDCVVVVTRYFGGTLLGTGGLVRAYTHGCRIAVDAAVPVRMEMTNCYHCSVPYNCWDSLRHALEKTSAILSEITYTDQISFILKSRSLENDQIIDAAISASGRKITISEPETGYEPWPLD